MYLAPDSSVRADEQRRYFPDWTRRLPEFGAEFEADHNSYLAGGYAEEFGYWPRTGASRGVPVIDGEAPEECAPYFGQAHALHPGYPIRPYPVGPGSEWSVSARSSHSRRQLVITSPVSPPQDAGEAQDHGSFIPVTERTFAREQHHPSRYAAALFTRFLAAIVALRWELPRRQKSS
jgi:hypothetical protein